VFTTGCYLLGQFFPPGFSPSRADSVRTLSLQVI
jgi:hypothetical protein